MFDLNKFEERLDALIRNPNDKIAQARIITQLANAGYGQSAAHFRALFSDHPRFNKVVCHRWLIGVEGRTGEEFITRFGNKFLAPSYSKRARAATELSEMKGATPRPFLLDMCKGHWDAVTPYTGTPHQRQLSSVRDKAEYLYILFHLA